ncbi:MFS transporter [Saccharomonospora sp. NPDC046836]|uniref:MFS transporter n=1 Tax=Saccharomonospora sp. NPDC046836 TaxID=3156921 RepID=UPI0034005765
MSEPGTDRTHQAPTRATGREWAGLALLVLPMLAVAADVTVLFFAMPTLSADLQPSATQALWIVHIYGFLIAGFLVAAGRLGDRIGPRRLMLIGSAAFATLSVVAAYSTSAGMLIAARAALGIAGATLMPSLFSLLRTMFRDDTQRRFAIAILFSAFSVGGAVGPLLGGALLAYFWWGSVFLINVPPLVLLLIAGPRLLPERQDGNPARIDLISVFLSVSGMLAVVYGLQELAAGHETGTGSAWSYLAIAFLGVCILALFARRQRRLDNPLFDLALLRNPGMTVSLATLLLVGVGVVGIFYLFTQYLQWVAGLSPLHAGLWTLPYIVLNIAGAMLAPVLANRLRTATVVTGGIVIAAIGAGALALLAGTGAALPVLVGAISLIGFGQGGAMALISDLIISSAPAEKTGSAAAAQEVGGELGSALGVAVGGAVGMLAYRASLTSNLPADAPETAAAAAQSSIHEGIAAGENLPELLRTVQDAAAHGLQTFAGVGGAIVILAAGFVVAVLGRKNEAKV